MIRWLVLGFFLLTPWNHLLDAADIELSEAGVVDVPAPAISNESKTWQPVEDVRGTSLFAAALDTWLIGHPHGVQAAHALFERARLQENLLEAGADLRRARGEGQATLWGTKASLELAKLEYSQERTSLHRNRC